MSSYEIKLEADEVRIGMYVTKLDRPWLDTPFMLQGFQINDAEDIELLKQHCKHCFIDAERSRNFTPKRIQQIQTQSQKNKVRIQSTSNPDQKPAPEMDKINKMRIYRDRSDMQDELSSVRDAHRKMTEVVKDMMTTFRLKKRLNIAETRKALKPMVDSIIRNPDALLWLNRLRVLDDYNYSHAMGCCIWAMSLGRQLGMTRLDIESLGLGALLLDVGKTRVPQKLLNKKEALTQDEVEILKSHVKHSMDIIKDEPGISMKIKNMVETHHERIDGSGYPLGLQGQAIPLFGRIAAIVDCYDAITSDRVYAEPLSSQDAVKRIYEWRGREFHTELVEEFIQAIGMYPAGTLVELTNGEVGVVTAESRTRRLRPKIMLLLNADKSPKDNYTICNLMTTEVDEDGNILAIKHALPSGSFNLKADEFFL